jgi:hypothetical protein
MRFASVALSLTLSAGTLLGQTPTPQPQTPPTLTDADKAAIKKLLNEAIVQGEDHPFQTTCSATSLTCTPPAVFISAAAISSIKISDFPANVRSLTVRVTAGESQNGQTLIVRRVYDPAAIPDQIVIAVSKPRRLRRTYGTPAASGSQTPEQAYASYQSSKPMLQPSAQATSDDPVIGFVALGTSDTLTIQLQMNDATPKTISTTLQYQRWFIDMGGFITFASAADEELVTENASAGNVKILKKRNKDKIVPGTGIVLNFHPANYPSLAAQFGLATSVDRAASYYLGFGYRLRELGPRTLATFAAGIAATQVKRFPDVSVGDVLSATATTVTDGSKRYVFGPYLSLSLGFSFGGVENQPPPAPR